MKREKRGNAARAARCMLWMVLVVSMLIGSAVCADAASISKSELKARYRSFLYENDFDLEYASLKFVDIDKNGVLEAICQDEFQGAVVLTYNKAKSRIVVLLEADGGKVYEPISYNTSKHMFVAAGANREEEWITFYKLKGTKKTRTKRFYYDGSRYKVNGKKVRASSYKKQLKAAKKGFKGGWLP